MARSLKQNTLSWLLVVAVIMLCATIGKLDMRAKQLNDQVMVMQGSLYRLQNAHWFLHHQYDNHELSPTLLLPERTHYEDVIKDSSGTK